MENQSGPLSPRQQQFVVLSAFITKSDVANLTIALNEALNGGLTINEINEVLAHLYPYCGFSASIRGMHLFKEVVNQRQAEGIQDQVGRQASPITDTMSKYERGEQAQMIVTALTAQELQTLFSFNPVIDVFLKEHLFADIFGRDLLSYIDREMLTVTALAAMHEPFVRSHIGGALNVGVTESQLRAIFSMIGEKVGKPEADTALRVLDEVIEARKNA